MKNSIEESVRIASLAVFKELYDSEKDVHGVIACFLTEIIITETKNRFTLQEITSLLNETFNFHIPEAVVKTSLGRLDFLKKYEGRYHANLSTIKSPSLITKRDKIIKNNELIVNQLIKFIQSKINIEISPNENEKIIKSFCSFLLDKSSNQEYSEYISAFIINKENDPNFNNQLQCIKEGVILYTGIMFNDNISNLGSWNTELTIFLETEIIFHFAGLNGDVYKSLFNEFFSLVKEINKKAHKTLIKLRYFKEIEQEIHSFFKKAEFILENGELVNPEITAMMSILDGCESVSDIIEKKAIFFDQLKNNNILPDENSDYYKEDNHKYNIIDKSIVESVAKSISTEDHNINADDISNNFNLLNLINIRRKENTNNKFEYIAYILLSGNSTTLQIAWDEKIRKSGNVPLATSLTFLTNKFWFKLNKGFGTKMFPKTFDIITKAQILLSSQLNKSVGNKFESLYKKFKEGQLNETQIAMAIHDLRKQAKKPEDISKDNLSLILDSLSEKNIDRIVQEQELFKIKAQKYENENVALKNKLHKQDKIYQEYHNEEINLNQKLLEEKKSRLSELKNKINKVNKNINNHILIYYKILPIVLIVIVCFIIAYIIIKYDWGKIEKWLYLIGVFIVLIPYIISICQEKTFNPIEMIQKKGEKYKTKMYNINNALLKNNKNINTEIEQIEKNINKLTK